MGARETALSALIACRKADAWSNGVLKEYTARDRLDRREAALASRLCYGVLQNRLKLDFYLQQLLTGRLKDLHPAVRDILHMGLYQLLETDRIPDSAAVNESVALTKKYCPKVRSAPGLVNAVLRSAIRNRDTLQQPQTLAQKYSHPENLLALLGAYVGQEQLESMLRANNGAPQIYAQVNTLKTTQGDLKTALEQAGVTVLLVSGRPTPGVQWVADMIEMHKQKGYLLTYNGSEIFESSTGRKVFESQVDKTHIPYIYNLAREHGVQMAMYHDGVIWCDDVDTKWIRIELELNHMEGHKTENLLEEFRWDTPNV